MPLKSDLFEKALARGSPNPGSFQQAYSNNIPFLSYLLQAQSQEEIAEWQAKVNRWATPAYPRRVTGQPCPLQQVLLLPELSLPRAPASVRGSRVLRLPMGPWRVLYRADRHRYRYRINSNIDYGRLVRLDSPLQGIT